jgi:26S proteasome regulatory subunit N2
MLGIVTRLIALSSEALYEDDSFPERELAAIVASKVYYHLQEYNESMAFALGAGKHFRLDNPGEFEDTIISKCVDTFIALSASHDPSLAVANAGAQPQLDEVFGQGGDGAASMSASLTSPVTPFSQSVLPSKSLLSRQNTVTFDPTQAGVELGEVGSPERIIQERGLQKALTRVIESLFETCFREKRYRQVVGIALEARNLDILRRVIKRAAEDERKENGEATKKGEELIEYVLEICMSVVQERGLRNEILKVILDLLNDIPSPDYFAIAKCVVYLDQHSLASNLLRQLVEKGDPRSLAVACQISFDLNDNSTQEFLHKVKEEMEELLPAKTGKIESADQMETDGETAEGQLQQELQDSAGVPAPSEKTPKYNWDADQYDAISRICDILDGFVSIFLNIEFLHNANRVDLSILNKVKDSLEARYSIFHTAVTLCAGLMHAKTANDTFFRNNLEWLGKATNWSKFTATAVFGVIHQGNITQAYRLLSPYLPKPAGSATSHDSPYSQGGSLYAYGLLCANDKGKSVDFIRDKFKEATEEVIQHGGALGLGIAAMASGDETIFDDLRNVLWADSAINGEAVGLAMGLVMLGSGNNKDLSDMIQHAHDTQHEKIVRGLAVGMALIMYGRQEGADELISGLLNDTDPTMRYGGILTIAMAYVGTGSNKAVRKLLHVAVSDVSDDVRRIAVLSLGFILFRKYKSVPRMVELLAESYNPHVRYGAAMALGISCAGTGLAEAIDLLEPMLKDPTDFVRQGALIALAMILVQQNDQLNPKVGTIRKAMLKIIADRHEDAMCKFGCAIAMGILDAGGRNCTISLQTQTGNLNMQAIVGMVVFTQYWYWFPLTHFLSLSMTPTAVIGIDQKMQAPVFKFHCNTRPSLFDYPPEQTAAKDEAPEKVKTAVLSTTAQARRRAAKKEKQQRRDSMDVDTVTPVTPKIGSGDQMDTDEAVAKDEADKDGKPKEDAEKKEGENGAASEPKRKIEKEKVGYEMSNMSRVLPAQLKYLSFPDTRYQTVKRPTGGIMVVLDTEPDKERETIPLLISRVDQAPPTAGNTLGGANGVEPQTPAGQRTRGFNEEEVGAGAVAAAGVLTAIDEDEEGVEDAPKPEDFDYASDGEEEGEGSA